MSYKRGGPFRPLEERFWEKVQKGGVDDCWSWLGALCPNKYGRIKRGTGLRTELAHRLSYELTYGHPGTMCVLHKCDNPSCCNPKHLFLGTQTDNHADMVKKRRNYFGSDHWSARIDEEQVKSIRRDGRSYDEIAATHGIPKYLVSQVRRRVSWKHVA